MLPLKYLKFSLSGGSEYIIFSYVLCEYAFRGFIGKSIF